MGGKPSAAASAVAPKPVLSGIDSVTTATVVADDTTSARFGMPQALVIIACVVTAAILAPPDMGVSDVLLLLGGAGGIGAVVTGGRRAGRIGRIVRAFSSGN